MFVSKKESITIDLIKNGLQMKSVSSINQQQKFVSRKDSITTDLINNGLMKSFSTIKQQQQNMDDDDVNYDNSGANMINNI